MTNSLLLKMGIIVCFPIKNGDYPLLNQHNYGTSPCLHGKTHYFDWAMFNSYVANYQRVHLFLRWIYSRYQFLEWSSCEFHKRWNQPTICRSKPSNLGLHHGTKLNLVVPLCNCEPGCLGKSWKIKIRKNPSNISISKSSRVVTLP